MPHAVCGWRCLAQPYLLHGLVDMLHDPDTTIPVAATNKRHLAGDVGVAGDAAGGAAGGATNADAAAVAAPGRATAHDQDTAVLFANIFSSQYNAATVVTQALAHDLSLVPLVASLRGGEALLGAVTNRRDHDTQCAALNGLEVLLRHDTGVRVVSAAVCVDPLCPLPCARSPRNPGVDLGGG